MQDEPDPTLAQALSFAPPADRLLVGLQTVVASWWFGLLIVVAIVVNTIVLALDSYPVNNDRERIAEAINLVLSIVFLLEMLLKLAAMGPRVYVSDAFNLFDAVIVIISVVEVAVAPPAVITGVDSVGQDAGGVSALRTFRLLRVLKLARAWISLRVLLVTVLASLAEVGNFAAVTLLFVMVIALFGAFSFANRFRFNAKTGQPLVMTDAAFASASSSALNFDDLWASFVSVFVVLAAEQWPELWFDAWRATGVWGAIFFVFVVIVLQIVLLKLFLAILLSKFEGLEEKTERERRKRRRATLRAAKRQRAIAAGSVAASDDESFGVGSCDDDTMTAGTDGSAVRFSLSLQAEGGEELTAQQGPVGLSQRLAATFGFLRDPLAIEVAEATSRRIVSRWAGVWKVRQRLARRAGRFRFAKRALAGGAISAGGTEENPAATGGPGLAKTPRSASRAGGIGGSSKRSLQGAGLGNTSQGTGIDVARRVSARRLAALSSRSREGTGAGKSDIFGLDRHQSDLEESGGGTRRGSARRLRTLAAAAEVSASQRQLQASVVGAPPPPLPAGPDGDRRTPGESRVLMSSDGRLVAHGPTPGTTVDLPPTPLTLPLNTLRGTGRGRPGLCPPASQHHKARFSGSSSSGSTGGRFGGSRPASRGGFEGMPSGDGAAGCGEGRPLATAPDVALPPLTEQVAARDWDDRGVTTKSVRTARRRRRSSATGPGIAGGPVSGTGSPAPRATEGSAGSPPGPGGVASRWTRGVTRAAVPAVRRVSAHVWPPGGNASRAASGGQGAGEAEEGEQERAQGACGVCCGCCAALCCTWRPAHDRRRDAEERARGRSPDGRRSSGGGAVAATRRAAQPGGAGAGGDTGGPSTSQNLATLRGPGGQGSSDGRASAQDSAGGTPSSSKRAVRAGRSERVLTRPLSQRGDSLGRLSGTASGSRGTTTDRGVRVHAAASSRLLPSAAMSPAGAAQHGPAAGNLGPQGVQWGAEAGRLPLRHGGDVSDPVARLFGSARLDGGHAGPGGVDGDRVAALRFGDDGGEEFVIGDRIKHPGGMILPPLPVRLAARTKPVLAVRSGSRRGPRPAAENVPQAGADLSAGGKEADQDDGGMTVLELGSVIQQLRATESFREDMSSAMRQLRSRPSLLRGVSTRQGFARPGAPGRGLGNTSQVNGPDGSSLSSDNNMSPRPEASSVAQQSSVKPPAKPFAAPTRAAGRRRSGGKAGASGWEAGGDWGRTATARPLRAGSNRHLLAVAALDRPGDSPVDDGAGVGEAGAPQAAVVTGSLPGRTDGRADQGDGAVCPALPPVQSSGAVLRHQDGSAVGQPWTGLVRNKAAEFADVDTKPSSVHATPFRLGGSDGDGAEAAQEASDDAGPPPQPAVAARTASSRWMHASKSFSLSRKLSRGLLVPGRTAAGAAVDAIVTSSIAQERAAQLGALRQSRQEPSGGGPLPPGALRSSGVGGNALEEEDEEIVSMASWDAEEAAPDDAGSLLPSNALPGSPLAPVREGEAATDAWVSEKRRWRKGRREKKRPEDRSPGGPRREAGMGRSLTFHSGEGGIPLRRSGSSTALGTSAASLARRIGAPRQRSARALGSSARHGSGLGLSLGGAGATSDGRRRLAPLEATRPLPLPPRGASATATADSKLAAAAAEPLPSVPIAETMATRPPAEEAGPLAIQSEVLVIHSGGANSRVPADQDAHEVPEGRAGIATGEWPRRAQQANAQRKHEARRRRVEKAAERQEMQEEEARRRSPKTVEEALSRLPVGEAKALRKHVSLCCLGVRHPVRAFALITITQRWFDSLVLVLIVVSSILLAIDTPLLDPASLFAVVLARLDLGLTVVFACEMVLKVISRGLLLHRGAYLRNPWNVIDGSLVVISILALASSGVPALRSLRSLRAFRALRPLRVIARNEGMRVVVNALFSAMPSIANVFIVFCLFILIFGIVGVGFLKGSFNTCQGPIYDSLSPARQDLIMNPVPYADLAAAQQLWAGEEGATYADETSKAVCLWMGAEWSPVMSRSFDNVLEASLALFEISTTEGWVVLMQAGVASRGIDMQPEDNASPAMAILFILFILVGSFFFLNAFVGVTIDNFSRSKEGATLATPEQKDWIRLTDVVLNARPIHRPRPPRSQWRRRAFKIAQSGWFEPFIMGCILCNAAVMAAGFFGMPATWAAILDAMNAFFTIIFTFEAALKLSAFGRSYWYSSWNVFDFIVVIASIAGWLLEAIGGFAIGPVASVVRTFRVARVVRLVKQARSLRLLFRALLVTLPGLANIASLLALFIIIYAILGQQLFAHVRFGEALNEDANFRSLGNALLLLIRTATGEDWNAFQAELSVSTDCTDVPMWSDPVPRGCGDTAAALGFFITFTLMVTFVLLNLVIGLLLEAFSNEGVGSKLSAEQIEQFSEVWAEFDPDAIGFISAHKLGALLRALPPPMGFGRHTEPSNEAVRKRTLQLRITTWKGPRGKGGQVQFSDVILGIGRWMVEYRANKTSAFGGLETGEEGGAAQPGAPSGRLDASVGAGGFAAALPTGHPAARRLRDLSKAAAAATGSRRLAWDVRHSLAAETLRETYRTFRLRWRLATAMEAVQRAWEARQQALREGELLTQAELQRAAEARLDEDDEEDEDGGEEDDGTCSDGDASASESWISGSGTGSPLSSRSGTR